MKKEGKAMISRREFMGGAAAIAASTIMSQYAIGGARSTGMSRPNSNFNGVQIGAITYSYRGMPGSAEDLLKYLVQCGLSSVELMGDAAENFAGMPRAAGPGGPGPGGRRRSSRRGCCLRRG